MVCVLTNAMAQAPGDTAANNISKSFANAEVVGIYFTPPADVAAVVAPEEIDSCPPAPALPDPTAREMAPPAPVVATPVLRAMAPEPLLAVVPVPR